METIRNSNGGSFRRMRRMRIRFPGRRLALTLAAAALPPLAPAFPRVLAAAEGPFAADAPKRPQALAIVGRAADELLLVGNRSGSVSVIRTGDLILLGETAVGGEITDLEPLPTRSGSAGKPPAPAVVAVDHERHALLLLRVAPAPPRGPVPFPTAVETPLVEVAAAFPTCRHPMRTALRGGTLAVSCLWSRRVVLYDLDGPGGLETPRAEAGLPFEAQELLFLDDRTLLAADGFAGGLAVVSAEDGQVLRVRELSAHNLRGLALLPGGTRVAVAHQELHSGMHTSSDDIRWGVFLTNSVSLLPVDDLRSGSPRLERRTRVLDLGNVLTPSGDPAALIAGADGRLAVALSGVGRLAFGAVDARQTSHVRVGRGPSAMVSGSGGRLYVANTRSDSISVVSLDLQQEIARAPLGPPAPLTAADRGEMLFHDASLSLRGWMSCASCHTRGHTNHRLSDTLGDGNYGAPKRVLSLLGVRDTKPWAWDGQIRRLEDQVVQSVRTTLRGRTLAAAEVRDLTAYLRTLELPAFAAAAAAPPGGGLLARGREAFARYSCDRCHRAPEYTSPGAHDVGLADELGNHRFNPPSLRGVRLRRRLLHDGSAGSLEEVFRVHPGHGVEVAGEDLPALIAFLRTL